MRRAAAITSTAQEAKLQDLASQVTRHNSAAHHALTTRHSAGSATSASLPPAVPSSTAADLHPAASPKVAAADGSAAAADGGSLFEGLTTVAHGEGEGEGAAHASLPELREQASSLHTQLLQASLANTSSAGDSSRLPAAGVLASTRVCP